MESFMDFGFHLQRSLSREGMEPIPGQSVWKLWWKTWHWDRLLSAYYGFPLPVSYHYRFILTHSTIIDDSYIISQ